MTPTVYTMGYEGRKPADLLMIAERLDATIVDIRYRAWSAHPQWRHGALREFLGDRYARCVQLGNKRYREPANADGSRQIELVDAAAGAQYVLEHPHSVILMCGCRNAETCHRSNVARLLIDQYDQRVFEIMWARGANASGILWAAYDWAEVDSWAGKD
ncbi:hypothetical protein CCAX7_55030 [Capsulimonas corticalis]|uniref:Uncharacterized protein n=1 Tax=Capsulimonas corticalis TaxID=2219043 RepID=A0A402D5W2_9BACT|nr:DUF488 family protein [Capsulimonas corticalis]BDI33452.1 hypothetical protein CCAX7_55030 [Capsulimonas corticalis]